MTRIKSIQVEGLLGQFDHEIPLNLSERITIIHGPNGVGKTTILRLLVSAIGLHYTQLCRCEFRKLTLKLHPSGKLEISKVILRGSKKKQTAIEFVYSRGTTKQEFLLTSGAVEGIPGISPAMVEDFVPHLEQVEPRAWLDHRTDRFLDLESVIEIYGERFPGARRRKKEVPAWLRKKMIAISTRLIQTQRLQRGAIGGTRSRHRRRRDYPESVVEEIAQEMTGHIEDNLQRSGRLAASLDRTFPHRIIQGKLPKSASEAKVRSRYEEQQTLRNRLMDAGLIQSEPLIPLPTTGLDKSDRKVLWFYLNDVAKKMEVFDDLLERAELFKSILDDKKFINKQIHLDQRSGISFTSKAGEHVPIDTLSSGEQQEIVLAYELLFRSPQERLVLIDEPELSLHVSWQRSFLDDITKISELTDLDFIIATHSPTIVGQRSDLMVALAGT